MVSTNTVAIVAKVDVLFATTLIIIYVGLMSQNFPELQLVEGSKRQHVIIYIYVSVFTVIQLLFAFRFYRALTESPEADFGNAVEEDAGLTDILKISKHWLIASYILLLNWIMKAGIYSQQCNECSISFALAIFFVEIAFRICAICIVNPYITQLEKRVEMMERRLKLEQLSHCGKRLSHHDCKPVERY